MATKKRQRNLKAPKRSGSAKAQAHTSTNNGYRNYLAAAIVIGAILLLLFFLKQFSSPEKALSNLKENNPLDAIISEPEEKGLIQFDAVASGTASGHTARRSYIFTKSAEWQELWASIVLGQSVPSVDFSQNTLIAVFQGKQNTGGYSIEVTKVIETPDRVTVSVKEISPSSTCTVTQASSAPYVVITIPKTGKEIVFETASETTEC